MNNGRLMASGHNWVEGQGTGARIDKVDENGEEKVEYDALGNPIVKVSTTAFVFPRKAHFRPNGTFRPGVGESAEVVPTTEVVGRS
jgi:hypothetical protein